MFMENYAAILDKTTMNLRQQDLTTFGAEIIDKGWISGVQSPPG